MGSLALVDIVAPYVLGGASIGEPLHELLSAFFVQDIETAVDDGGVVVSGMARFSADIVAKPPRFTPPASISFGGSVAANHRTARHDGAWTTRAALRRTCSGSGRRMRQLLLNLGEMQQDWGNLHEPYSLPRSV